MHLISPDGNRIPLYAYMRGLRAIVSHKRELGRLTGMTSLFSPRVQRTVVARAVSFIDGRLVSYRRGSYSERRVSAASLEKPDVDKLSKLAQMALTKEEEQEIGGQIERIVDWFGALQEIDVSGVDPALKATVESEEQGPDGISNLRSDTPSRYEHAQDMLKQVPDDCMSDEGFVLVPKTTTEQ